MQLDPSGSEGAVEGRHPQGRPDGHRPGQDEVPQTHLPVSQVNKSVSPFDQISIDFINSENRVQSIAFINFIIARQSI